MNKKARITLQIAGFKKGMLEKTSTMGHWAAGLGGLGAGVGLGALGHKLLSGGGEPAQTPYKAEQDQQPSQDIQLTPEEQAYLMSMYSQDPYSAYNYVY